MYRVNLMSNGGLVKQILIPPFSVKMPEAIASGERYYFYKAQIGDGAQEPPIYEYHEGKIIRVFSETLESEETRKIDLLTHGQYVATVNLPTTNDGAYVNLPEGVTWGERFFTFGAAYKDEATPSDFYYHEGMLWVDVQSMIDKGQDEQRREFLADIAAAQEEVPAGREVPE